MDFVAVADWRSVASIRADTVDVWKACLDHADPALHELLAADERARATRFHRSEHAGHWASARAIQRALLGEYLDADPAALRFELGPYGKPALAEPHGALQFNVSHTQGVALYAIASDREVGVDIEREDRRADDVRVARRIFGETEAARLAALDPITRRHEFLRAWVRHEAVVKCLGTGIGGYRVEDPPEDPPWLVELDVGSGAVAAVAVSGGPCEVRCWEWPSAGPL
jgi:4'-phosphopantetheinyl transferase